jgi:homoserine dehydrogenase
MATKQAKSKKASSKKSKKKKMIPVGVKSLTLGQWFAKVEKSANEVAAAGEAVGACLVTDPHTGTAACVLVDQKTCKALKGTFIGGPCGG